jgi:hypothetical protein
VGSLRGDSGEEGNSGEVVMLGREEVVTRPSSGRVPPRTSIFHLPPLTQISMFNTNSVFVHPLDKEPCWQGVALTALLTSFQTCTLLDSGVVLEFESARSNLVDYVMLYD